MKTTAYSLALISSLIATANASAVPRQTCSGITPPLPAITADGTGVSGLQLGNDHPIAAAGTGSGILTTTGYTGWNFGTGGLGTPWCPTSRWLNIGSSTHPWKLLTWSSTQSTTTWETGYGVYLTAAATSDYAETSNYLACKPITPSKSIVSDDTLSNADISTCVETKLLIGSGETGTGWW